jgi:hypothetical protein
VELERVAVGVTEVGVEQELEGVAGAAVLRLGLHQHLPGEAFAGGVAGASLATVERVLQVLR